MTTTINHKHESTNGIRISKKKCVDLAEAVSYLHNVNVTFYGRYEWDATGKSYVRIAERDEMHAFKTQTEAYFFMGDLEWELHEAELAAEAEATTTTVDADGEVADEGTTVDESGEIVESDENEAITTKAKKSYAKNGYGLVFAFNSKRERDAFIQLVNDNVANDRGPKEECMTTCTAREAYKERDSKDRIDDDEYGRNYYDMSITEFYWFNDYWMVLDQMYPTTEQATTTDEATEQAIDLSHTTTAAWIVACDCCLIGTGYNTDHFANNYLFRDDIDAALTENVRAAREMVAGCIDRADEFRIEGEELDALADELRMLDAWLDANDHAEGTEEATIITIDGDGYYLTTYEAEDGWQALGRIGGYDIDTVWCDCHGLSFDDLDSVILHVFESALRERERERMERLAG